MSNKKVTDEYFSKVTPNNITSKYNIENLKEQIKITEHKLKLLKAQLKDQEMETKI